MDVERVDGGYGSPGAPTYALGSAEARRPDMDMRPYSLGAPPPSDP